MPLRAASSAALCAANAVDFLDPLNPTVPALPQAITLPMGSVNVMMVLLNVDCMYALPVGTTLRSRRLVLGLLAIPTSPYINAETDYFLVTLRPRPGTALLLPRLARALVRVRCPLTGSPRR